MVLVAFVVGIVVGFGLAVWLFRTYLRRHPREVAASDTPPTSAGTADAAPSASEASREVSIPMDIVDPYPVVDATPLAAWPGLITSRALLLRAS